jgi:hypothetical protein
MIKIIKSAARKMLIDFGDTQQIPHNPTKGRAREYVVFEQFLDKYLPSRFSIGSGIVIDSNGQGSKQQDLVIYDEFYSPVLYDTDSDEILFPESVLTSIEVKSTLRSSSVDDIVEKSASVWRLSKTPTPPVSIAHGMAFESGHAPTLCAGISFESDLTLDGVLDRVRKARNEVAQGHALSLLCILKDRSEESGVVVNVKQSNIEEITLTPTPESRLMKVDCETAGDALLLFYLLVMQHLRKCGMLIPGPNLLHYASESGLGEMEFSISREEFEGAKLDVEGESISLSAMDKIKNLTQKIFNSERYEMSDVVEWYYLIPEAPKGHLVLDERTSFAWRTGEDIDMPSPARVYKATERIIQDTENEKDQEVADKFFELIKVIKEEERGVIIKSPDEGETRLQFGRLD